MEKTKPSGVARAIRRYAMARDRTEYVNKLQSALIPALRLYYRLQLAARNDLAGPAIDDWQRHEEQFLDQFTNELLHTTKTSLDRRKAYQQAVKELQQILPALARGEATKVKAAFPQTKELRPLPQGVESEFFAQTQGIVDTYYPRDKPR